jgi:putative MATE family efflux protein
MIGVNLLNIVLNPILIFGYFGLPALGVAGSALATVIARTGGLIAGLLLFFHYHPPQCFIRPWGLDPGLLRKLVAIAVPSPLQSGMRNSIVLMMFAFVAPFGTAAISGYGIADRMEMVALLPGLAIGTATAVIVGQNLGAGLPDRAEEGVRLALALYGAIIAAIATGYFFCAEWLVGLFDPTGASVAAGASYFHWVAPAYIFIAACVIFSMAFNGAGDTRKPMIATFLSMVAVQLPLAYVLPEIGGLGLTGVWIAVDARLVIQAIILAMMFRGGSWKRVNI